MTTLTRKLEWTRFTAPLEWLAHDGGANDGHGRTYAIRQDGLDFVLAVSGQDELRGSLKDCVRRAEQMAQ